jgi:hypothetical protein
VKKKISLKYKKKLPTQINGKFNNSIDIADENKSKISL